MKNLKKSILSLVVIALSLTLFSSCKKDKGITPSYNAHSELHTNSFSGVVFIQSKHDVVNLARLDIKRLYPNPSWIYSNSLLINNSLPVVPLTNSPGAPQPTIYDSIPVNLSLGDSIFVGAYKTSDESILLNSTPLLDYSVRVKVYLNGSIVKDTISNNGQYFFTF